MDKLGINLGFLIFQCLNFSLLLFLLGKFVWPKILNMLDQRAEKIAQGLEDARAAEQARQNAERERDRILAQARVDSQKLMDEARQRGEDQIRQALQDATREAEDRRAQSRTQAEEERNRILADTRDQIAALAMAAAERLIGEAMDANRQRTVIKKFFSDIPADAQNLGKQIEVVSAVPLTSDEQAEVKRVTGAEQIDYRVDPDILGGLVLRSGDKVVDGSVRGGLTALSASLR